MHSIVKNIYEKWNKILNLNLKMASNWPCCCPRRQWWWWRAQAASSPWTSGTTGWRTRSSPIGQELRPIGNGSPQFVTASALSSSAYFMVLKNCLVFGFFCLKKFFFRFDGKEFVIKKSSLVWYLKKSVGCSSTQRAALLNCRKRK